MLDGKILIGGKWVGSADKFEVRNPYSGQHLADVANAGDAELESALTAAKDASVKMRSLARFEIAKGLRAISAGIESRKDEFVRTIALESAKPVIYARAEVERAISTFSWAAGEVERFAGETVPIDVQPPGRGKWGRVIRVPRGVIYGITPFNFPLNLVAHKVAPALASGNAIIIKPSPRTPLTSLLLGQVFLESGLPPSALQIVPTAVSNVERIISDDRIAMLSFTGRAAVGWDLKTKIGKKPIALELGGNAPVIIDETADDELSLSRCVTGAFAYSGQVCISVQRIYVHESKDAVQWITQFRDRVRGLRRGDPLDDKTQISVMIDEEAAKRAKAWIDESIDKGAKLWHGGTLDGTFLEPTILFHTYPQMRIVAEEAFAPVVIVERFHTIDEAVEMCNNSKYGLQAAIFSQDQKNIDLAVDRLEYGGVIVNDAPIFRVDNMPYGGMKESGFGREGVRYAMEEMTEIKLAVYDH